MLQFLGARNAWLGCPDPYYGICDLRTCPSFNDNYRHFDGRCWGALFQIVGDGTHGSAIKSGQQIRLRYLHEHNSWMGCPNDNRYDKRTCPGTTAQGSNFSRCGEEIFKIYARGRTDGQIIYNGDVVMLYYVHDGKYVTIEGQNIGDDTSLNFCPGVTPPAYLSYGICSKNAFRIYRKP